MSDPTSDLLGRHVFDAAGQRIGRVDGLYRDITSSTISFAAVSMIRRGRRRLVFVSLVDATIDPTSVTLRCGAQLARRAPQTRPGQELTESLEGDLYRHYEIPYQRLESGAARLRSVS
jgi:sporulation protein YlmC with PRC-barrel domain